jgi:hypothetical protein
MRISLFAVAIAALVGAAGAAEAQPMQGAMPPRPFVPIYGEGAFERKTVRGAPYAASTETELVQTLADGNRIAGRWTGFVARDTEGRVRREQPLAAIGPLLAAPDAPRLIVITDPVLRVSWFLDPEARSARRIEWLPQQEISDADMRAPLPPMPGPGGFLGRQFRDLPAPSTESLGARDVAGVKAEGTRSTYTIPAGQIGNERPVSIVSERWSSPELDIVVETRHSDPRLGETRYRVTSLEKGEPEHALFETPADYAVEQGPPPRRERAGRPGGLAPNRP